MRIAKEEAPSNEVMRRAAPMYGEDDGTAIPLSRPTSGTMHVHEARASSNALFERENDKRKRRSWAVAAARHP